MDVLDQSYVQTETEEQLASNILAGAWCLVLGHRQSGKTSTVLATRRILRTSGPHIQLLHIPLYKAYASSGELWQFLARRIHGMDPLRFPVADRALKLHHMELRRPTQSVGLHLWRSLQCRQWERELAGWA